MAIRDFYSRDEDAERRAATRRTMGRPAPPPQERGRDGLLTILWRRKAIVVAGLVLGLACGAGYILVTPSRYLSSTAMLIDPRLGKTVGADPVQPGFIVDTGAMDSQIKLFTSQTVLARVGKMAGLVDDPEFNGSQRSILQRILHPDAPLDGGVDLKALEQAITIKRPERTYIVGIDVLTRDPQTSARIANDLTQAYIEDQINSRVDSAQDDTRYVREQMSKLATQIKEAEEKVETFKTKNNVVDLNGLRSNEQQVTDLTKALGEARARSSDAKARLDEIERLRRQGNLDSAGEAVKSLTIERLRQQQAETEQNVAKLAMTLGTRHPELMEARSRETKIRALIRDELRRLATSADADYQSAHRNETQIAAEVDQLKTQSNDISTKIVPLQQLERNVKVLRASFDRFAQIRDNLTQQEADSPPGRVIAVARPSVSAASPKKTIVGLVSLGAGVFLGLAAALFAEGTSEAPVPTSPPSVVYEAPVAVPPRARQPQYGRRYWDDDET